MDESLTDAFRATEYRVNTSPRTCVCIRIGQPLPFGLRSLLPGPDTPWGYITAWNPACVEQSREANDAVQQAMLAVLRLQVPRVTVLGGEGVGSDGWTEASIFVIDAPLAVLDLLMHQFGQLAIVHGTGDDAAALYWNEDLVQSMRDADSSQPLHER